VLLRPIQLRYADCIKQKIQLAVQFNCYFGEAFKLSSFQKVLPLINSVTFICGSD